MYYDVYCHAYIVLYINIPPEMDAELLLICLFLNIFQSTHQVV